jgi:SAM-dependent methyltransferase
MNWLLALLLVPLLLAPFGCSRSTRGAIKRWMYETPGRDHWQKPAEVVAALGLARGDRVADIGAGGGYFTFRLAEAVGESGRVYAVDVDASLLAYVEREAEKRGLPQVTPVLASADDPGLSPDSVDWIFLSNVFHHLPEPVRYFEGVRSALRADGRVAIVEVARGGFPPGHTTPPEEIRADLEAAGYGLVARHDLLGRQSFQIFAIRDSEPSSDETR